MLLGDILHGKESSHLVLINDSVGRNGRPLIYYFVKSLLQRADFVHVVLYDVPPDQLLGSLDDHFKQRIFCYDGFSDPLGWNCLRNRHSHVTVINKNSNVAQVVKNNLSSHFSSTDAGNLVKVAVVIDSLSKLLLWNSCSSVCTLLHQLYTNAVDSLSTGYQIVQVVCLVHADLHDDQKLNSINFLASSILWITEMENETQTNSDKTTSWCKILHKRKTGKVVKKVDGFAIGGSDYHLREYEEKDWTTSVSTLHMIPAQEADPMQNLTFNLRLTDHERQARANLQLPYIRHDETRSKAAVNSTREGKVFYQPDEADDFDEDDPDDDLDI